MNVYEFVIVLDDVEMANDDLADRLFDAGCDDGTLYSSGGEAAVGFAREAESLEQAIRSAVADLRSAGILVRRVDAVDGPVYSKINAELASR